MSSVMLPVLAHRILSCVSGLLGSIAVVLIIGLVALWRFGGIRLALAGLLRLISRAANRISSWLVKAAIGDE
jgi:hypothetical protein